MTDLNVSIFEGRLTRNAEMSMTKNGQYVYRFCLANNRSSKNEKGEWQDEATFLDCVFFTKQSQMFSKGDKIIAKGYLKENSWTDKNNNTHRQLRLVCESVKFLQSSRVYRDNNSIPTETLEAVAKIVDEDNSDGDEEIPF